jgi:hypothetical protein
MITLQFLPYSEIERLSSDRRISKLLSIARDNKIVLLQGRLKRDEEAKLIERTMEEIDDEFKGIELSVIYPDVKDKVWLSYIKNRLFNLILGERNGMTVIGPANVVKEIKKDPNKIELFTQENKRRRRR